MSRRGQERDAGKVSRGSEHVAPVVDYGPAKIGIDEILLLDLPGQELVGTRRRAVSRFVVRSLAFSFALAVVGSPLEIEMLDEAELSFVGVAEYVAKIKANDRVEILDTVGIAINHAWLDHVFDGVAKNRPIENLRQSRRPDFHAGVEHAPVERIADRLRTGGAGDVLLR